MQDGKLGSISGGSVGDQGRRRRGLTGEGFTCSSRKGWRQGQFQIPAWQLVQLDSKEIELHEEKKSLIVVQPGGQNCCINADCPATNWLAYPPELVCSDQMPQHAHDLASYHRLFLCTICLHTFAQHGKYECCLT